MSGKIMSTEDRLRQALSRVADEVAEKNTTMPIVIPVRQIMGAVFAVFSDVPRVPDLTADEVAERRWMQAEVTSGGWVDGVEIPAASVRVSSGRVSLFAGGGEVALSPSQAEEYGQVILRAALLARGAVSC